MEYRIPEICQIIGGGTPKTSVAEYWNGDICWLSVKDFAGDCRYVYDTEKKITELGLNNSSTKLLQKDDIIISARGTVGEMAMIPYPMAFNQSCFGIRGNEKIDNTYLYYLLKTKIRDLKKQANGAVFDTITISTFNNIVCDIPELNIQKKIAAQLSEIDDKIAVNRRICENLEAQAQALFKHWFIDFAPFKNGKFVESELGMIPEGWRVGRAEDFYTINIGKTPPRAERQWFSESRENNKIWISISDMGGCGAFISDSKEYLTPEAQSKFNIVMVPVGTVLLSFKLTLGRVAIADAELTTNEAIARFFLPSFDYREYTYLYLKQFKYGRLGSTSSIATAVNSKIIKAMPFLMPPKEVIMYFSNIAGKLFDEIKNLNQESTRLSTIRDTLLPKLMSGQIKV